VGLSGESVTKFDSKQMEAEQSWKRLDLKQLTFMKEVLEFEMQRIKEINDKKNS
jgi:hypothetical protein